MALATNTTTGEIKLAGDLAGSNDGNAPELTNTAVTPGEYTVAKVTVDSKGRITNAINSTSNEITGLIDPATVSSTGVVQVGSNLYITGSTTSGNILITFSPVISAGTDATGLTTDACATYSIDISVDDATAVTVEFDGAGHQTIQDILDTLNGVSGLVAALDTGHIRITSDSTGNTSNISLTNDSIFNCVTNFSSIGASVRGISPCELYAKDATDSIAGVIQAGSGVTIVAGVLSVDTGAINVATDTTLGVVIVPTSGNLDVDGSGNISVPLATSSALGVVKVDTSGGLAIAGDGTLSYTTSPLAAATTTTLGGVIVPVSSHLSIDGSGNLSMTLADSNTLGVVKSADVANITITSGDIDVGTNIGQKDTTGTWTKSQNVQSVALTSGTTVVVDASLSNSFTLDLAHNLTINNPVNLVAGGFYTYFVTQDASTFYTVSFGTNYKFKSGSDNSVGDELSKTDVVTCISDGTSMYCSVAKGFV